MPKRAMPKFITSEDLKRFFGCCTDAERRLFMSILLTGMRKGEVEHLTWDDISFELAIIFIQGKPDMQWKPKADERIVPISPILNDVLVVQYTHRTSDRLVFANEAGNPRHPHPREPSTHLPQGQYQKDQGACAPAQLRRAFAHGWRELGGHCGFARAQGPGHDPDLRQGPAGALTGCRGQARASRASRGRRGPKSRCHSKMAHSPATERRSRVNYSK